MEQKLFKHQIEGISFLKEKQKVILADEMGLGKTRQAILAAENGATIICPASLKTNWKREIEAVMPEADITTINGTETRQNGTDGLKWLIINYDIIDREQNEQKIRENLTKTKTLILDEAHYIKNSRSKRSKKAIEISRLAERVYLLTGTPIMNRPIELFNLLRAIDHHLGQNWYSYVRRYCGAFFQELRNGRRFLNTSGATHLDELKKKTSDVILRRTKDELGNQLPAKIITEREVEMTKEFWNEYEMAWDNYMGRIQEMILFDEYDPDKLENIQMARHIIELQKLKQVASRAKIKTIVGDAINIIEQDEKIIIFTQYSRTLEILKTELEAKKIKVVTLSGQDDAEARQQAVDKFQNDKSIKVFIGNIKASGVGITLTAASTVLFTDMEWTPAIHEQAEDRAHRIGQNRLVSVYYYIAKGTVDEDIIKLLKRKSHIIQAIMDGNKKRVNDMSVAGELIKKMSSYTQLRN